MLLYMLLYIIFNGLNEDRPIYYIFQSIDVYDDMIDTRHCYI